MNVTQSLFGMTPQMIQSQREADLQAQALRFAQLTPMQQAQAGLFTAGSQLGTGIAGALGYEDPEMAQARARQGLLGGVDFNDPQALLEAARSIQGTDPQAAQMLVMQANEIAGKQASVRKSEADMLSQQQGYQMRFEAIKKRFPEISEEEARAVAQDEAAFREVFKDQQTKLSSFAQQLADEGLKPGTPEFQSRMRQFNERQTSKKSMEEVMGAGLTGIAAAVAGERAEAAAKAEGSGVGKAVADIGAGERSLAALQNAKDMLKQGIFAGAFGPAQEKIAKFTGGIVGSRDRVANTEEFRSYIGQTVMPMMAMLGGSDSNEELKKMEAMMAANTILEPEAMKRIIDSAIKAVERDIARAQKQQEAIATGAPLPIGEGARTPTRRWNAQTGQIETITR